MCLSQGTEPAEVALLEGDGRPLVVPVVRGGAGGGQVRESQVHLF